MQVIRGAAAEKPFSWASVVDQYRDILPVYPAAESVVRIAVVPGMPRLTKSQTRDARAMLLLDAYRVAVRYRHERDALQKIRTADDLRMHVAARSVYAATDVLLERDIPPLAWAVFSMDAWTMFARGKGRKARVSAVPSLAWVFSAKRLVERDEWFAWDEGRFRGTTHRITPSHRELQSRWQKVVQAVLLCEKMPTRGEVEQIVKTHLPRTTYTRLQEAAADEADAMEARWRKTIRRGGYVW